MKLTAENIQFIDNYLKNSEVIYYDIRMEMLDHVATAVEQKMEAENLDFYDAFKSYMLVHKKEVLKNIPNDFKILAIGLKNYFLYFFTFKSIASIIVVFLFFKGMELFFKPEAINYYRSIPVFIILLLAFLYYHFKLKSQENRFYSLETTTSITFIFYQSTFILNNSNVFKQQENTLMLIIFISCLVVYYFFYKSELNKVKNSELYKLLR
jgi:hypothetical protein